MKKLFKIVVLLLLALNLIAGAALLCSGWGTRLFVNHIPIMSALGLAFPVLLAVNLAFIPVWLLFKRSLLRVPAILLLLSAVPIAQWYPLHPLRSFSNSPEGSITVISYNTRHLNLQENKDHTVSNPVLQYLNSSGADLICLQESSGDVIRRLKNKDKDFLPDLPYLVTKDGNPTVLSRWPIVENHIVKFPDSGNNYLYCRIVIGTDTLALYNCHLQSLRLRQDEIDEFNQSVTNPREVPHSKGFRSTVGKLLNAASMRASQTDMIVRELKRETARYIILCGDFNDTPVSYPANSFRRLLYDCYRHAGNGQGRSYRLNGLRYRIDHIYVSGNIQTYACRIDQTIDESDHYPVIARISLD